MSKVFIAIFMFFLAGATLEVGRQISLVNDNLTRLIELQSKSVSK